MADRPTRRCRSILFAFGLLACGDGGGASPDGPPRARITAPEPGMLYRAGTSVAYAGEGVEASGDAVPADRLTWWVEFHHDTHTHPFLPPSSGREGLLVIPDEGETDPDVFYRIHLRAEDSEGRADTAIQDLQPLKGSFRVASVPSGLVVLLDGQPRPTPLEVEGVAGIRRRLGVASPQSVGGQDYVFGSWSNGAAPEQVVVVPEVETEIVANFNVEGVSNLPPAVTLVAPPPGLVVGEPVALRATASDADGQVASVSFLDGTSLIRTVAAAPFEATWTPATAGTRNLAARATDDDGAVGTSAAVSVTVGEPDGQDTEPPEVRIVQPPDSTRGLTTISVVAEASDNEGVVGVEFRLDGAPVGPEDTATPWGFTVPGAGYTSGQHEVRARARDAAGNRSAWARVTLSLAGTAGLPDGFVRELVEDGFSANVTALAFAPDGRIFVALQNGRIEIVSGGTRLATPFADLTVDLAGERGLIGLALDPAFASNGRVFVHYTTPAGGSHNRISRLIASGNVATAEAVLVDLPPLSGATNHNGGALAFGPDGKLYVGVGDNANSARSPDLASVFGKLLRFNPDGSIPPDNPFFGQSSGLARAVWARGLRNPFTFAFDPATGLLLINDVGAAAWEEVNTGVAGGHYGWPAEEGPSTAAGVLAPRYAYPHEGDFVGGYAIVGGGFYRPTTMQFPADYAGDYFFGDYVTGEIHRLDPVEGNVVGAFAQYLPGLTALGVGPDGALYVGADAANGHGLHRIRYAD